MITPQASGLTMVITHINEKLGSYKVITTLFNLESKAVHVDLAFLIQNQLKIPGM